MICDKCYDAPAVCRAEHCESCCSCGLGVTGILEDDLGKFCVNCETYKPAVHSECEECEECCTCEVE